MTPGIAEKIANQMANEVAFGFHDGLFAPEGGPGACRLFGHQRPKIDGFEMCRPRLDAEAARQQDFVDQFIEFLDVALDPRDEFRVGIVRQQRHGHADPGKRRSQFMGCGCQGIALGINQILDASRQPG